MTMPNSRRALSAILGALALLAAPAGLLAATKGARTLVPTTTAPERWPDVAYDPQNNVYLVVTGNQFVQGAFLSADGALLAGPSGTGTFNIGSTTEYSQSPRVACGPGICAVFWGQGESPKPMVRLISYQAGFVGAPVALTSTPGILVEAGHGIEYADGEFVAAWAHSGSLKYARVSKQGQLLQSAVLAAAAGWKSGGHVAYNPVLDEVIVSFAGTKVVNGVPDVGFVSVQRFRNGSLLGGVIDLATGGGTYLPHGAFSDATGNVMVAYYKAGKFYAREVRSGGALGAVTLLKSTASYDALDFAYNAAASRFLLVTHGPSVEDVGVEVTPAGVPSAPFEITSHGGTGNFNPRVASHATSARWLTVTSNSFKWIWTQFALGSACTSGCGGSEPPPPPPPPSPTASPSAAATAAEGDFTGDGAADLVWRHSSGGLSVWRMSGLTAAALLPIGPAVGAEWKIVGTGDLDGDGKPEIVWQHDDRWLLAWFVNGQSVAKAVFLSPSRVDNVKWKIAALADVNGDKKADILWQHDDGWLAVWYMNGTTIASTAYLAPHSIADTDWRLVGAGDLNGDGKRDLVWRHSGSGVIGAWMMNGATAGSTAVLSPGQISLDWRIGAVVDLNADGKCDLVWQHKGGSVGVWLMNGTTATSMVNFTPNAVSSSWTLVGPR